MRGRRILIAIALGLSLACSACCVWALAPLVLPPKDRVALSPLEREMKQAAIFERVGWGVDNAWFWMRYRVEKMKVVDEDTRLFCMIGYTFFYYESDVIVAAVSVDPKSRSGFIVSNRVLMSEPGSDCEGEFRY